MRLVSAIYGNFYPFNQVTHFDGMDSTIIPNDLRKGDVLVSWGGEDISSSLYNKKKGPTHADINPSRRDMVEWDLMKRAVELDIPIIGVCRGAQMLCALAGGFLIQHVNKHGGDHQVKTQDGKEFVVNSYHHQMQYPFEVDHELVAWSDVRSNVHIVEDQDIQVDKEPEFVYYPGVKGFAIQWHPEWMDDKTPATQYVFNYIKEKLNV